MYNNDKVYIETETLIPDDFDFNKQFKELFDIMEHSDQNLFITGKAGTGKTTLLHYFRTMTHKNVVVLAPTGVAAIKVRGQTLHSFFKLPPSFIHKDKIHKVRKKEMYQNIDAIIIDEASMIRADILDGIDQFLRINRQKPKLSFGGVQVILFGDLFQLPPVVDAQMKNIMQDRYEGPYFFNADIYKKSVFKLFELEKIYRQKDDRFIALLNKVRSHHCTDDDIKLLNARVDRSKDEKGVITLTTTNYVAKNINDRHLANLKGKQFEYSADIDGSFEINSYPVDDKLKLKIGTQVMLTKNDPEKRWVNGSIGEIVDLHEHLIKAEINGEIFDIPLQRWEKISYSIEADTGKIIEEMIGDFKQYPLRPAWAITIHKSQGQTFDKVIIDIGRGAFSHGQTYVALSRCRSIEGITLKKPIWQSDLIMDQRIYDFMNNTEIDDNEVFVQHDFF